MDNFITTKFILYQFGNAMFIKIINMRLLNIIFLSSLSFFHLKHDRIDDLLEQWNKVTLSSLKKSCSKMKKEDDRSLCEDRLNSLPGFLSMEDNSVRNSSIRWKFLKTIDSTSIILSNKLTLIEIIRSGEKVKLNNNIKKCHH